MYYVGIVFMPFLCIFILVVLFFVPLNIGSQKILLALAEIFNAWSALEAFIVAIVIATFQLSMLVYFMVQDYCNMLKDDTCFDVHVSMEPNSWYLFVGAILNVIVVFILLALGNCVVNEREEESEQQYKLANGCTD